MGLENNQTARERILVCGGYKTGKSTCWVDLAKWIVKTETDSRVYLMDTDDAYERMVGRWPEIEKVVTVTDPENWEELTAATEEYKELARPEDWIVMDMIDSAWAYVQQYYTEQIYGKSVDEWFMDMKKSIGIEKSTAAAFSGKQGENWGIINKVYRGWVNGLIKKKCHKMACTPVERLDRDSEDKATMELFGKFGVRPAGQKALGHQFHTVLLLKNNREDEYKITTMGDRERRKLDNQPMNSFVADYLMRVGGWTVA